ncbi:uncharacterized protein B0I36DRAFT_435642 [Microdochium trichocladiopsis]|uniref:Uncharacterized protein n=1 Tax=Microdochium trichocladiopsis TaxID=1682393 RepID=A0A9P8XVW6_9PEZI|nr:uncharacterized protein B0I36DRAFT_435642 [Microdochium trichocladiopsis]KAH7018306.1 hypothetical protein B0I36DRAFT_435642 [Microdochium trichocladiopsis]
MSPASRTFSPMGWPPPSARCHKCCWGIVSLADASEQMAVLVSQMFYRHTATPTSQPLRMAIITRLPVRSALLGSLPLERHPCTPQGCPVSQYGMELSGYPCSPRTFIVFPFKASFCSPPQVGSLTLSNEHTVGPQRHRSLCKERIHRACTTTNMMCLPVITYRAWPKTYELGRSTGCRHFIVMHGPRDRFSPAASKACKAPALQDMR